LEFVRVFLLIGFLGVGRWDQGARIRFEYFPRFGRKTGWDDHCGKGVPGGLGKLRKAGISWIRRGGADTRRMGTPDGSRRLVLSWGRPRSRGNVYQEVVGLSS
jgi:hypothetical protein